MSSGELGGKLRLPAFDPAYDETTARIQRYEERPKAADEAGISNQSTQQFKRLLETAKGRVTELESEIERLKETYGGATAAVGEYATAAEQNEARLADLQTQLVSVNQEV